MQKQYMPTALPGWLSICLLGRLTEAGEAVPKFATDAERSAVDRLDE
jgi:hypothetical protein